MSTLTAVPDPESPELPAGSSSEATVVELAPDARARRGRAREAARKFRSAAAPIARSAAAGMVPPDIVRMDQPSLAAALRHARWGQQHPEGSPLRALGYVYCLLIASPVLLAAHYTAWVAVRPARLFVAAVVVVCAVVVVKTWL